MMLEVKMLDNNCITHRTTPYKDIT